MGGGGKRILLCTDIIISHLKPPHSNRCFADAGTCLGSWCGCGHHSCKHARENKKLNSQTDFFQKTTTIQSYLKSGIRMRSHTEKWRGWGGGGGSGWTDTKTVVVVVVIGI